MLKLYNTLTRKKEVFKPLRKDWVGLYTCGPTVYNYAHIGNLRTYIFEDILRRALEYAGFKVRHVMNITDVEDKIIRDSRKENKDIFEFVKPYEKGFYEDLAKLNIKKAWKYPKATSHVKEMIKIIQSLLKRGLAYESGGSIYFDISKFKNYGKLSRLSLRKLKSGTRVDMDEYTKDNAEDFVLWKTKKEDEPSWPAPFGDGRPGWHIECSAMSMKYLGSTFDIHGGAVDLIFPHHENEIAQSESATGKKFARFFVEGEHLLVNGEKMAKSLGNFFILRDIESRNFNSLAFRYLILTSHYRSKFNFTWDFLRVAQNSLERLCDFVRTVKSHNYRGSTSTIFKRVKRDFENTIFDDLGMPKALATVWDLVRQYNKNPAKFNSKEILKTLYDFDKVLGLGLKNIRPEKIPAKILELVKKREGYRKVGNWAEADKVRAEIKKLGYILEDTPSGSKLKRFR